MEELKKIIALRSQLCDLFAQREEEVTAVLLSLASGEPCLLVGPPGTAKTAMVEALASGISAKYFYYLLTRFTEPDELLGPIDIAALRRGEYKRITANRLPEAEIVFLDEVFKASSAVRNVLLDIILNKRILNGVQYVKLPTLALYTASNEISTDAEDAAFCDRLVVRCFVGYVSSDAWDELLTKGVELTCVRTAVRPIMTAEDVRRLQEEARRRALEAVRDASLREKFRAALAELKKRGIELSDRRKVRCWLVAAAASIVYAEPKVTLDSLAEALRYVAPFDAEDVAKVEDAAARAGLSTIAEHVQRLQALEVELRNALKDARERRDAESLRRLSTVYKRTLAEVKRLPRSPRLLPYVRRVRGAVEDAHAFLEEMKRELGLD